MKTQVHALLLSSLRAHQAQRLVNTPIWFWKRSGKDRRPHSGVVIHVNQMDADGLVLPFLTVVDEHGGCIHLMGSDQVIWPAPPPGVRLLDLLVQAQWAKNV